MARLRNNSGANKGPIPGPYRTLSEDGGCLNHRIGELLLLSLVQRWTAFEMQYALLLVLSWVGRTFTTPPPAPSTLLQAVLTTVLNAPSLAPYLRHYLCRQPVYFRFGPSTARDALALRGMKNLALRVRNCPALVYNTTLDERRHPVITVQVLQLSPDTARVRIGLPIEGVTGQFTLLKAGAWAIHTEEVVER